MSALESSLAADRKPTAARSAERESLISRFMRFISSVRFGVSLLIVLGLLCFLGMIIMQQNVDGFERYFAELTPAQRLVYGKLGLFDIYHAWYFNVVLAVLSLNIILASIDRFPKAWKYFSDPTVTVPVRWLRDQKQTAETTLNAGREEAVASISSAMRSLGWKKILTKEKDGRIFVLGQSGTWNRLGAYAVHVGLLTIFTGGFLTAQLGSTGQMPLSPGRSTDLMFETVADLDRTSQITKRLPFEIACTDIQQKLIQRDGSLSAMNTIDWITRFTIKDETGTHDAMVQMNRPFDFRGYRFFQASFIPVGRARSITVTLNPADGSEPVVVTIPRDGSATLQDGTKVKFLDFRGNFRIGPEDPNEDTSSYPNPGAVLQVTPPGGAVETAYTFGPKMANIPVASKPVAGYTYRLTDFEKVGDQHVLSVQRDPGATVVYVGFVILCATLIGVFAFSHQRVWAAIEPRGENKMNIVFGGHSNRNPDSFDRRFRRLIAIFQGERE